MNILLSKESVGRVALIVVSITAISMGAILHNNIGKLESNEEQLVEANKLIERNQLDYKEIKDELTIVQSENEQLKIDNDTLIKKQNELSNKVNQLQKDKNALNSKLEKYDGWEKMSVEATGYSLVADEMGSDGDPYTATGTYPTAGRTIAVDPSVIPYGSKVRIPALSDNVYIAEDTGGMINGKKIDIYFNHGDIAREWGRQEIVIFVNKET